MVMLRQQTTSNGVYFNKLTLSENYISSQINLPNNNNITCYSWTCDYPDDVCGVLCVVCCMWCAVCILVECPTYLAPPALQ